MSVSSRAPETKYDVFLSFRGEDTRDNFVSYLHDALLRRKINIFIDNDGLSRGDEISQALLNAIEESKISVVVFSKDYASSKWCLDELVKILECNRFYKQIVIPVFYRIDPSVVKKQIGSFEDAFDNHEARFRKKPYVVQRWRDALVEAASLAGWSSLLIRRESTFTETIVEDIMKKLNLSINDSNDDTLKRLNLSHNNSNEEEPIKLGPWGGPSGSPWSFNASAVIIEIIITYGMHTIKTIRLKSSEGEYSKQFGEERGEFNMKITLGYPGEYLTSISGTHSGGADGGALALTSLCFQTNIMAYDVGHVDGTRFSCPFERGVVVGFHGRAGTDIDSLGFYLRPFSYQ